MAVAAAAEREWDMSTIHKWDRVKHKVGGRCGYVVGRVVEVSESQARVDWGTGTAMPVSLANLAPVEPQLPGLPLTERRIALLCEALESGISDARMWTQSSDPELAALAKSRMDAMLEMLSELHSRVTRCTRCGATLVTIASVEIDAKLCPVCDADALAELG